MTPKAEISTHRPVIVVVDDDPAVCNSLKFSLELEGFAVRTYRSGAELLDDGPATRCDCFVVDQRMPDMNGLELIARLRARRIATPAILIISDRAATLNERAAKAEIPIIEKPLLNNALVDKIREVCAATRAG